MIFERTQNNWLDRFSIWLKSGVAHASAWVYVLGIILISLEPSAAVASQIAYAQSPHNDSEQSQDILHLFDADQSSRWCSMPAPGTQTHHLQIALKKKAAISHIDIEFDAKPSVPLKVEVSNGRRSVSFALTGDSIHLKFERQFQGQIFDFYFETSPNESSFCMRELKMLNNGVNFIKLPKRQASSFSAVIGTWFEGKPGTTEKKLTFAMDGTWDWIHKPFFGQEETRMSGTYTIKGNILTLVQRGSGKTWSLPLNKERVVIDPDDFDAPDFDYDTLVIEGSAPSIFAGRYNNARFDALN